MIDTLAIVTSDSVDPYGNLALEEYLLGKVAPGLCILYLWQNENTVVIGRNQSALDECDCAALAAAGGHLARRLSGGGAVYHDLGNQNFTFLMPSADFDKAKQTLVLCEAMRALGMDAQVSGRNDLTIDGKKFSGHAYYHSRGVTPGAGAAAGAGAATPALATSYHHGTIMVDVDGSALSRYLNVNPLKLAAKGVKSVRSRVANLVDFVPGLSCATVRDAVATAFGQVYGLPVAELTLDEKDLAAVAALRERYASDGWLYKDDRPLEHSSQARFDWGTNRLDWTCREGRVVEAALWSDGLDADLLEEIPRLLIGVELVDGDGRKAVFSALTQQGLDEQVARDLASMLL